MKKLEIYSKEARELIYKYEHAKYETLDEAYKRCSEEKKRAYWNIVYEMRNFGGYGMRITGKSSNFFSCAYIAPCVDKETGEITCEMLVYHTYANTYIMNYK